MSFDYKDYRNHFEVLHGATLEKIELSEDKYILNITAYRDDIDSGTYYLFKFHSRASCCNDVWFDTIDVPEMGGSVISSLAKDTVQLEESDFKGTQQYEDASFWTIATTKGYLDISVRNSNNGYYSGEVCLESVSICDKP